MTSRREYVDGQIASDRDDGGFEEVNAKVTSAAQDSGVVDWRRPVGQVWMFAALIFLISSAFFVLTTGVTAMVFPLSFVALGVGAIGTLRIVAVRHRSA